MPTPRADALTRRLRRDWFHHYLLNPLAYRPGTRMPTPYANGKTTLPAILGGSYVIAQTTARSMRTGSSRKRTSGSPMERMSRASRSRSPPA